MSDLATKRYKLAACGGTFSVNAKKKVDLRFYKLPHEHWRAFVNWHRIMARKTMAETVSYHKWVESAADYITIIPHQRTVPHGLAVHVDWGTPENAALLDAFAAKHKTELFPACTIHTHVNDLAYASHIDDHDEVDTPGWHITLGELNRRCFGVHARIVLPPLKSLKERIDISEEWKVRPSSIVSDYPDPESIGDLSNPLEKYNERVVPEQSRLYSRKGANQILPAANGWDQGVYWWQSEPYPAR